MKKINWEKVNKFVKNRTFVMALCVFGLTMASIGFTYASFFSIKTNTTNQSITTGTLNVTYGTDSSVINKNSDLTPMNDEMGLRESDASVIYIQNTGSLNSTYVLTLGYDMTNFTSRSGYSESDELTPLDYVMVAVYEYHGVGEEDTLVSGPVAVGDLPIFSLNSSDSRYNRYALLFDTLGGTTTTDNTKTYKVKAWLSDKAIPSASYTYFYVNAEIVAEVENAKMKYNLSGTLTDGSNALSGATISVQNNSVVATTSSTGTFTLNGLYPGTYNVDITYDNVTYSGNLTVEEGTSVSLASLGSTFSGTDIYNVAYTYGTTLAKLIKVNNLDTYSSKATISSGSLAPTYKFVGAGEENISGISISLDTTNKTYTMNK